MELDGKVTVFLFEACSSHRCSLGHSVLFLHAALTDVERGLVENAERKHVERKTSYRKVIGIFLIRHYLFDIFLFEISLFDVFHHTRQKYRRIYKCIYLSRDVTKFTEYSVPVNSTCAIVNTTYFQMQRTNTITWARCDKQID